jgi:hypothetical protein
MVEDLVQLVRGAPLPLTIIAGTIRSLGTSNLLSGRTPSFPIAAKGACSHMPRSLIFSLATFVLVAAACGASSQPPASPPGDQSPPPAASPTAEPSPDRQPVTVTFDFRLGDHGWQGGFSDFSDATRPDGTAVGIEDLPAGAPEGAHGSALLVTAANRSDDVFMFIKRQLGAQDGLARETDYLVSFVITYLSDAPTGCMGVGGAPGESVYLKAGATPHEPLVVEQDGEHVMSVDKGNQAQGGPAASVAGNVANGIPCDDALGAEPVPFGQVIHEHGHDTSVRTDSDATLWLLVGADSGFESRTTLYYQSIEVILTPAS